MTVHASLEQLSSYLDAELAAAARTDLEAHLSDCPVCRHRLDGLRGVVARLERLEQQAPPAELALLVERRVAAVAGRDGLRERLEQTVKTFLVPAWLTPIFGLVVALSLILYLFSFGVARHQAPGTRVVVPLSEPTPGAARMIEGRDFTRVDGVWVERGLGAARPDDQLDFRGDSAPPIELAPFAQLGGRVRLAHEGRVIELIFD